MFSMTGSQLLKKGFQQSVISQNERRKEHSRRLLDAFNDEQIQFVEEFLAKLYSGKKIKNQIQPLSLNIVKKIVSRLAGVYTKDATRIISGTDFEQEIYANFEKTSFLGVRMKQANRLSLLLGNVLLRVLYRDGKCDVDILTPDLYTVQCGSSATDLVSITIDHWIEKDGAHVKQYKKWTKDSIQTLDYNYHVISEEENPYKCLPFVSVFNELPIEGYFQSGMNSLFSCQKAINNQLSDLFHILRLQGFAVPTLIGTKPQHNSVTEIGVSSLLQLPENSKFEYVAPNSPIENIINAIDFLMKNCAVANGLPADSVSIYTSSESGLSKLVSSQELLERIEDQKVMFLRYENEVFNVFKTVYNTHNNDKMSDSSTLKVNFNELKPATSNQDIIAEQKQLMELGLASQIDALQALDPDLTVEESQKKLLEIKDFNQEFQKVNTI